MRRCLLVLLAACGSSPDHADRRCTGCRPHRRAGRDRWLHAACRSPASAISAACAACSPRCDLAPARRRSTILVNFNWTTGYVDPDDRPQLTAGGQHMAATPNAGGSSGLSEIFAYEELARCELATFLKSETEIIYDPVTSKKTDLEIMLDGHKIGVSVTRAFKGPFGSGPLDMAAAVTLSQTASSPRSTTRPPGPRTPSTSGTSRSSRCSTDNADDATTFLAATATLDPERDRRHDPRADDDRRRRRVHLHESVNADVAGDVGRRRRTFVPGVCTAGGAAGVLTDRDPDAGPTDASPARSA